MSRSGIPFRMEHPVSVKYKEIFLDCGYRLDFLVEDQLIIECKSIEEFAPIHSAQVLTYLRLSRASKALLINFNVYRLKYGIKRFVL